MAPVSPAWLEERLGDPSIRIVEVCSVDQDTVYRHGHIPGAVWCYWKDWCWHERDREFVSPRAAARHLGASGIDPDATLVLTIAVEEAPEEAGGRRAHRQVQEGSHENGTGETRKSEFLHVPTHDQPRPASGRT